MNSARPYSNLNALMFRQGHYWYTQGWDADEPSNWYKLDAESILAWATHPSTRNDGDVWYLRFSVWVKEHHERLSAH